MGNSLLFKCTIWVANLSIGAGDYHKRYDAINNYNFISIIPLMLYLLVLIKRDLSNVMSNTPARYWGVQLREICLDGIRSHILPKDIPQLNLCFESSYCFMEHISDCKQGDVHMFHFRIFALDLRGISKLKRNESKWLLQINCIKEVITHFISKLFMDYYF